MMEMGMEGAPGELSRNRQKATMADVGQKPLTCCWARDCSGLSQQRLRMGEGSHLRNEK